MYFTIAVSGKKQSGKDTLVDFLYPIFSSSGTVESFSFADELKKFLITGLGLMHEGLYGTNEQKNELTEYLWENLPYEIRMSNAITGTNEARKGPMSNREIMQVFGTDIMRNYFDDKIWVNSCFRSIEKSGVDVAFIPDMRFPSELNPWIEKDGLIIRLMRDVSEGDSHSSETALDGWDWEQYGDSVLVIPEDTDIEGCRKITLEWLVFHAKTNLMGREDYFEKLAVLEEALGALTDE